MPNPYTLRPVTAAEYFKPDSAGRGGQAHRLLRTIRAGNNVSLIGERRFGKSSLLGHLERMLAGIPKVHVAGVNILSLSPQNPEGFYCALTRALIRGGSLPPDRPPLGYSTFETFLDLLEHSGERLVLLIDEFDLVARDRRFTIEFFDNLRSLASLHPLAMVIASVAPLAEIAHSDIYGSPFFNIFLKERLALLSPQEAEALIEHPPGGGPGLGEVLGEIRGLAGRHPYFLQLACHCAWDLREDSNGAPLDLTALRSTFLSQVQDHCRYIWDHSSEEEKKTFCTLASGTRSTGPAFHTLTERGYATVDGSLDSIGSGFCEFVRDQCKATLGRVAGTASREPREGGTKHPDLLRALDTSPEEPELRLALVVGVDQYLHQDAGRYSLPPLQCAEKDAEVMAGFLKELGFAVKWLAGARATYTSVLEAFEWLKATTSAASHPNSCFVFHFSGHGHLDPNDDEVAYLMLRDSDPCAPMETSLEMSRLVYHFLAGVRVPNALVLLDACHAGYAAGVKDMRVQPINQLTNVTQQLFNGLRGRMILAACAGEAQAREELSLGHGVFTHYVLRHWRDRDDAPASGRITFGSLIDYVGRMMPQDPRQVSLPVYSGVGVGSTFVLPTRGKAE
jgi:hypothetical protein